MTGIQWLFFDIGNTLIDESRAIHNRIEALIASQEKQGRHLDYDTVIQAMTEASIAYSPSPFYEAMEILGISERIPYPKECEILNSNALETVKELYRGYHIGVIANQADGTAGRLVTFGLSTYIEVCVSSTEEGLFKPDLAIYRLALERVGCDPHNAVMIGDRLDNDIYPAKKCGMRMIWFKFGLGGMQKPRSAEYEADFTIVDMKDLLDILSNRKR